MSEELIDKYVDRAAFADDTKFITEQLKVVLDLFDKVNAAKITLSGAKGMSDVATGAKEAAKAVDELSAGKKKLLEVDLQSAQNAKQIVVAQVQQASGVKVLNDAYDKLIKQLIANEDRLKGISEEMGLLQKAFNDGKLPLEKFQAKMEELRKEQISLKSTNQDATRAIRNFNKEAQGSEGSLKQMRAELNLATQAFDGLSRAEKQTEVGQQLKKQIIDLTEAIKQEEEETKRFFRNVGNYPASAKIIVEALEKAKQKFNDLSQAADTTPAALEDARRGFESLRAVVDDRQFVKYAASAGDAQKEVKAFTRVLVDLEQRGEGNSEAAIELRKHLAELTDQVADAKDAIKALSSDTHSFDQFAGAVNFAVDTVQTFVGAMSLNADSEEDVAEATKTLIALQTVANGIKGIATELTTRGTAANKLYAFAQNQVSIAMDTTATAGARLKAVLTTIGFGAAIIGIGLLIANFDKIKRAISGVTKEQEALNEVMKESSSEYAQAVKLVSDLKSKIDLAKQGVIEKESVIKIYNDSLGKTTGQVKSLEQAEKELTEKGDAYVQMTLKKAVANIALEKAAQKAFEAEEIKRKKQEEFGNFVTTFNEANARAAGLTEEEITAFKNEELSKRKKAALDAKNAEEKIYTDIAKEAEKAMSDIAKAFNLNLLGNNTTVQQTAQTKKFREALLKDDADMFKKLSEVEDAHLVTRLSARNKAAEIERQILEGQKKVELDNLSAQIDIERQKASVGDITRLELIQKEKEFNNKKAEINKDYGEKQSLLERNLSRDIVAIRQFAKAHEIEIEKQYNEDFKKFQEERLNSAIESIQKEQLRRSANDAEGQAAEIKALNDRYDKQVLTAREGSKKRKKIDEKYANDRAEIEYRYSVASINNEIDAAEKILSVHKEAGINVSEEEKRISDLRKDLSDIETKHIVDNEKKKWEAFQERMQRTEEAIGKILEIESKVSDIVGGLISANVDKQKNAVQEQIDDVDKKKEKEIEAINASSDSEQLKAEKIAKTNATAQAQKEGLERRQRQLDLQRARFEKAANITRIAIETNLAVVHQLGSGDPYTAIGRAIAVGIIGAAQLAAAIAQPIPKFKTGRQGGPATLGVVGDGGVPEVVTSPDFSQAFVTPAKDTLTYLPKDWKVFPDIKTFEETAMNMAHRELPVMPIIQQNHNGELIRAMAYEIGGLKRAIMGKQETHFHWHNGELRKSIQIGNSWDRYIQDNI